ncbi:TetR family transcriptional regulator [Actinoalloteichus sp. AHMU CJ021]|uniref:Transcriptional regulator, TetR family n=1 Tax=Actinoalloteichus caeruleus DSM 43889 TaxID=1120930 RepID=A0ABT1JKP0_ACTCY|nr:MULTISPECIES: TetR family transcriptional regulator [Actinoalloteichus]AUS78878.1 TetR family transcriptional regulator [Actinoalloteichus sp. AHMU CJ021]MCP2333078.1 transcriptional regulator, TetR family [Actinoalloteichus caeruleus DSM 43889]
MTAESRDGRVARGDRRRALIVAAAVRVVEREGVAGLTHRAVAAEAGVSPTSTAYHFATVDDLMVGALRASVEDSAGGLLDQVRRTATDPVRALADYVTVHRGRAIAEYELYLQAARRPALRPIARQWLDALSEVLRPVVPDETARRALVATVDGLLLQSLLSDEPPSEAEMRALLGHVVRVSGSDTGPAAPHG